MNRLDFMILKVLERENCASHFHSMTLQEIMEMSKSCRTTTSRKIKKLREQGYVERGCGDWQAYTYYITEKGLKLSKSEEDLDFEMTYNGRRRIRNCK